MTTILEEPQAISADHDESVLAQLSIALNGCASIQTVADEAGNVLGYSSIFPIDLTDYPTVATKALAGAKTALKARVDDRAEALRLTLITPGAGQAMEYQEAYAQAQAALSASGAVKAADYPMLAATVGVELDPKTGKPATDVVGVARAVKAAYESSLADRAAIRGARLKGKAAIEVAKDVKAAQVAFDGIAWPDFS